MNPPSNISEALADPWLTPMFDNFVPEEMKRTALKTTLTSLISQAIQRIEANPDQAIQTLRDIMK